MTESDEAFTLVVLMNVYKRYDDEYNISRCVMTQEVKSSVCNKYTAGGLKGIEHLKPLLMAIKDNRKISFNHFNFHSNKTRKYALKPYLLKEYQNRWYVVGIIGKLKEFRTFGIDRIENLEVKTETFKVDNKLNPMKMFEKTIGLVYASNTLQDVILSFTPTQGKYIKTLPLHTSQKVLLDIFL